MNPMFSSLLCLHESTRMFIESMAGQEEMRRREALAEQAEQRRLIQEGRSAAYKLWGENMRRKREQEHE